MDEQLAEAVRACANYICEYCRLPQAFHLGPFEIEHVISLKHFGPTTLGNLAFSCLHDNRHKGSNLAGIDRVISRTKLVRLFNPCRYKGDRHFRWDGPLLVGRTAIERVTIQVLELNDPTRVALRSELIDEGVFPP